MLQNDDVITIDEAFRGDNLDFQQFCIRKPTDGENLHCFIRLIVHTDKFDYYVIYSITKPKTYSKRYYVS